VRVSQVSLRQVGETEPFIQELLNELTATIQDLETHQIHMFYEAVGLMISADSDKQRREQYLVRAVHAALCTLRHATAPLLCLCPLLHEQCLVRCAAHAATQCWPATCWAVCRVASGTAPRNTPCSA
jgi:hypothetical protein